MNIPHQSTLPRSAKILLAQLGARKVSLSIQYKVSEAGNWYYEIQACGPVFAPDWQKLRQYHDPIVSHLISKGAIDNSFDEVEVPARLAFGSELQDKESVEALCRRARMSKASDERAVASRNVAREVRTAEKNVEVDARSKWTDEQTRYLQKSYFSDEVWPHHYLSSGEINRRKEKVIAEIGAMGTQWDWRQIRHRIRHLQLCGRLERKSDLPKLPPSNKTTKRPRQTGKLLTLQGSEKQIKYAAAIRAKKLGFDEPHKYTAAYEILRRIKSSVFWIENQYLELPDLIKAAQEFSKPKPARKPSRFRRMVESLK